MNGIKAHRYALSYDDCSIRVYRSFTTISHKCLIAININFIISYYAGIMLNAFNNPLCSNYAGIIGGSLIIRHCFFFKPKCRTSTSATSSSDDHFYLRYGLDTTRFQKTVHFRSTTYISWLAPFPIKFIKQDNSTTFPSLIKLDYQQYWHQNPLCSYLWHS